MEIVRRRRKLGKQTRHFGKGGVLVPAAKAGEQQSGAGRGDLAEMGEGGDGIVEEHHAVARDQQLRRENLCRLPAGGVSQLERDVRMIGPALAGAVDQLG